MNDVLTLILGGGRGTRLYPLTHMRSKPAVPIGGKYRLIDIPISNCLHAGPEADLRADAVQLGVAQPAHRADLPAGPVLGRLRRGAGRRADARELATGSRARPTPCGRPHDTSRATTPTTILILAGDHLYRMDFCELIDSHIESRADITIAAQPVTRADATEMGIFRFDDEGQIVAFEEKPNDARLTEIGSSLPRRSTAGGTNADKPFVASMGIYVFSRDVLLEILEQPGVDFGKEILPKALATHRVHSYIFRGYWADVGTIEAFYDANIKLTQRGAPFNFFHPRWPIYTHPRFLPATRAYASTAAILDRRRRLLSRSVRRSRTPSSASGRTSDPNATHLSLGSARRRLLRRGNQRQQHSVGHRTRRRPRQSDRGQERADRRRRPAGELGRRRPCGWRPLLHPRRHHHRAEGSAGTSGVHSLSCQLSALSSVTHDAS